MVFKHGLIQQYMKDNGKKTNLMAKENSPTVMEIYMKEIFIKVILMAMEYIIN